MDVLFFINLVMDSIIFFIVTMILNKPIGIKKIFVGSIMATSLYCILVFMPVVKEIPPLLYTCIVPSLSILYMYKPVHIKQFIKFFLICHGVAFIIGGSTFSLWYLIGYKGNIESASVFYLISIGVVIGIIVYGSFNGIRRCLIFPYLEYELEIIHKKKQVKLRSLLDTGNLLYTPISHKAVIVATQEGLDKLLSDEQCSFIKACRKNTDIMQLLSAAPRLGISVIPFNSIGCKTGFLVGIEVERVRIYKNQYETCFEKCIIGVSPYNLFNDKSYNALLHPDFIIN